MHHEFHFKRGDLEFSFKGERDFVEAQIRAMASFIAAGPAVELDVRPQPPAAEELPRVSPDFRPRRNISLADLVKMKAAVAPTDLVVVAGYYMEKYMQTEAFDAGQLTEQLRDVPAWDCQVVDEVLPITVMQGYMEELPEQRYTLTYKGQTYVRDGLNG